MPRMVDPHDLMQTIAREMDTDTKNLLLEHQECWQKIQTTMSLLPTSVQSIVNNFLAFNGPPLNDSLTLRHQIGQSLYQAGELAEDTDSAIARSFDQ